MIKRLLMTKVLDDPDNALKIVLIITAAALMPFMILISIIGAASSSVSGFFNPDSGEDFDPEKFKTSEVVTEMRTWYEEYLSEYENTMNTRKAEVESENTTIERIEKPKSETASSEPPAPPTAPPPEQKSMNNMQPRTVVNVRAIKNMNDPRFTGIAIDGTEELPGRGTSASRPDTSSGSQDTASGEEHEEESAGESKNPSENEGEYESGNVSSEGNEDENMEADEDTEVEEHEVCHVNVIISMGEFPLSAVLSYYNLLFIKQINNGGSINTPSREQINEMLASMTVYEENAAEGSEDYYISMHFKDYTELPETIFTTWGLTDEEYKEYSEMYLNITQMVASWIDEDLSSFENEESNEEEETDGELQ